jgi:hypothetical protein
LIMSILHFVATAVQLAAAAGAIVAMKSGLK